MSGYPGSAYPGAPPQGYPGAPPQGYPGAPPQGYPGAPPQGYPGAPPQGYPGAPPQGYPGAPPQGYPGAPTQGYPGAPPQGYPGVNPQVYSKYGSTVTVDEVTKELYVVLYFLDRLRISWQCCGSGSGIRCLFWPLDPGSGIGFFRIPDLGSRIPKPYFWELCDNFLGKKLYNS